jgi:hypothetical protein
MASQAAAAWSRFAGWTGFSASAVLISSSGRSRTFHVELLSLQIRQLLELAVGNLG